MGTESGRTELSAHRADRNDRGFDLLHVSGRVGATEAGQNAGYGTPSEFTGQTATVRRFG